MLQLRYANNSEYKKDTMIRKEMFVTRTVLAELRRIIVESEVMSRGQLQHQHAQLLKCHCVCSFAEQPCTLCKAH